MEREPSTKKDVHHDLIRKIRFLILGISLIPLILTTGILSYGFVQSHTQKIHDHIHELVQKHTLNIDTFLWERVANIRYLAELYPEHPMPQAFVTQQLSLMKSKYENVFVDLGVVDNTGRQIAYQGPFRLDRADYSNAHWFIEAQTHTYYISDVFIGLRGHPHFIVAVKAQDHSGRPSILRATVNLTAFSSLVENIHIGKTGFAVILNSRGELQTRKPAALTSDLLNSLVPPDSGLSLPESGLSLKGFRTLSDAQGLTYISLSAPLCHVDWQVVFCQRERDAFSQLRRTQHLALVVFLFGVTALAALAHILPRKIQTLITRAELKNEAMSRQVVESGRLATIGELAAGIAHEINNPVAIMSEEAGWMQDLLSDPSFDTREGLGELERALDQIRIQGRRCKEITHKLLRFARKGDAQVQEIQINDAVAEIVDFTAQMAQYTNVDLKTDLGPELPLIKISLSELQQILLNLINNALDAIQQDTRRSRPGEILIRTRKSPGPDPRLIISVTDDGPGIPGENLERIFDPFFTTKPVGQGTGLGLSICYGIIQKLEGEIYVTSRLGEGTQFRIFLPLNPNT